jgi:hypothetical protein
MVRGSLVPLPGTVPTNQKLPKVHRNFLGKFKSVKIIGHIEYDIQLWLYGFTPSVLRANEMPRQSEEKIPVLE